MTEEEVTTTANGEETKEDVQSETVSDLERSIIRQVEYYFGDVNLVRDKFLREQVKLDEGWVPFDVLTTFNRLASLTKDTAAIAAALDKSTTGLLEVSEDKKKVRRHPDMPVPEMNEERRKELQTRTVYAKGLPKDSALDDLLKYFNTFGEVETLIMRRYLEKGTKKRNFKGSVFVTYKTKDTAEKFLTTPDVKYNESALEVLWQEDYLKKKQEEYAEKKDKQDKKTKNKEVKAQEQKEEFKLPTGTVLFVNETTNTTKREDIKEALTPFGGEIAFIDYKVGDTQGWVRYTTENAAKEVYPKIPDGKLKISDTETTVKLLEGDEEKAYLEKTVEEMAKRRKNQKSFGKFKNQSNRNQNNRNQNNRNQKGRFGKKRKQDNNDDGPPAKVKADAS